MSTSPRRSCACRPSGRHASASISNDDRLLLDVVEALRGADNLRDRLLMVLQTGAPAVADLAYAIKARVKEDYKVVDKIKDRRRGGAGRDPEPNYHVSDVTDIVGLRVVTLYRLDTLEVIETLLSTINADTSAAAAFVPGSISKVKIYSTNPKGDVQGLPAKLMKLFEGHGLGAITKVSDKPSNYSSIHILLRGRGKYKDGYREVAVEVQIRTGLEDIWGQIEHSLKYKRQIVGAANDAAEGRLATTLAHLGALKTMIDGIAQYGDQIKLQIDELEPELRYTSSRAAEEPSARLSKLHDVPTELRGEIADALADAKPGLNDQKLSSAARIRILRSALSRLEGAADEQAGMADLKPKTRKELGYVLAMQRALIHFQLGNLLDNGEEQLARALDLYGQMARAFPARLVVAYRYARTLDAAGARDDAIAKLREMVERLNDANEPTPKDHWIRAAAPRGLGVLLWEAAMARETVVKGRTVDQTALNLLREAYMVTRKAYEAKVTDDPVFETKGSEHRKAVNNLLYYALEYLDAGGNPYDGLDRSDVVRLSDELGARDPGTLESLNFADTARRAHAFLKDSDGELAAARQVLTIANAARGPRPAVVRDAVRSAERAVERLSPSPMLGGAVVGDPGRRAG